MTLSKRLYWIAGLVAVMALAAAAVTMISGKTSAQTNPPTSAAATDSAAGTDTVVPCSDPAGASSDTEPSGGADTDSVQEQCGDQNETADTGTGTDTADAGTDTVVPCAGPTGANSDTEPSGGTDTDNVQEQCGDQSEAGG